MKTIEHKEGVFKIYCPACKDFHFIPTLPVEWCKAVWKFNKNLDNPTFTPSVDIKYDFSHLENPEDYVSEDIMNYRCHFTIEDGKITYCDDCNHSLKGSIATLPNLE